MNKSSRMMLMSNGRAHDEKYDEKHDKEKGLEGKHHEREEYDGHERRKEYHKRPMPVSGYDNDEAESRDVDPAYRGRAVEGMTREIADMWMAGIVNADGTTGPRWTMDQMKQVAAQRGIDEDPLDFWVAMNAEYSDRCKQYDKHGVNTIDMYVDGVMAFWLHDDDAVKDKLSSYYEYIVKH